MSRFATMLAASLAVCLSASAVTLQQLSTDEMTQNATAIVRARVTGTSASLTGSTIYTHYKLQVSETWKGAATSDVVLPGGVASGYRQTFPGVPQLKTGSEYVLFLWTSARGVTHILGMTQGMLSVTTQSDGTMQVGRPLIGEAIHDAAGRTVQDHAVQMNLLDLKIRVRQIVSQGGLK